jgi:hypothetical protein
MPATKADQPPDQRTGEGHQDRLPADHPADLSARGAHRPQQADLARAFQHRQRHRVHHSERGDDDGQPEHPVDQVQQIVDLLGVLLLDLGLIEHLQQRVLAGDLLDLRQDRRRIGVRAERDVQQGVLRGTTPPPGNPPWGSPDH